MIDISLIEYFLELSIDERLALNRKNAAILIELRRHAGIADDRFDDDESTNDASER